jgi:GntR family transcriptional regulator
MIGSKKGLLKTMGTATSFTELFQGRYIDRNQPAPLYEQLQQILVDVIKRGQIKPGEQMPGEKELEEHFRVSRITVRRALSEMVTSGYLRREAGRGTFVMRSVIHDSSSFRLGTLMDSLRAMGESVTSTILALHWEEPSANVARALDISPQSKLLYMNRLVMVNRDPAYLAYNWIKLPEGEGMDLDRDLLKRMNIWDALEQFYGIVPYSADQTLQAVAANREEAETLKVLEGTPLMMIELTLRDASNQAFGYVKVIHIGTLYKFHQVLYNVGRPRQSVQMPDSALERWVMGSDGVETSSLIAESGS